MLLLDGKFINQIERKRGFPHSAHSTNRHQCTRIEVPQEFIKMPDTTSKGVGILVSSRISKLISNSLQQLRYGFDVFFHFLNFKNSYIQPIIYQKGT